MFVPTHAEILYYHDHDSGLTEFYIYVLRDTNAPTLRLVRRSRYIFIDGRKEYKKMFMKEGSTCVLVGSTAVRWVEHSHDFLMPVGSIPGKDDDSTICCHGGCPPFWDAGGKLFKGLHDVALSPVYRTQGQLLEARGLTCASDCDRPVALSRQVDWLQDTMAAQAFGKWLGPTSIQPSTTYKVKMTAWQTTGASRLDMAGEGSFAREYMSPAAEGGVTGLRLPAGAGVSLHVV
eukprot:COSAG01_NODE_1198_length_11294_cov_16.374632_3_plen_233_part_00